MTAQQRGADGRFVSREAALDATDPLSTIKATADGRLIRQPRKKSRFDAGRRQRFLAGLSATSNVRDSARKAGICPSTAYDRRKLDRNFADAWDAALAEGHELLTLEILHRARFGTRSNTVERDRDGVKKEIEKIDFRDSVGLHLLTRHDRKQARGNGPSAPPSLRDPAGADAQHDALIALLWAAERDSAPPTGLDS